MMLLIRKTAKVFLLLAGLVGQFSLAGKPYRDWNKHPAVIQRLAPNTLFAIGDVHGDYERFVQLLQSARIIPRPPAQPEDVAWSAGGATLILTGDMVDKGPRSVDVLRLLNALAAAARRSGGEVIALAGNHEAEFLAEPGGPKSEEFAADLRAHGYSPSDVAACHGDLGELLCGLPFAARIGDWFFSHAGNTNGRTLTQLSSDIEVDFASHGFSASQLIGATSILEARVSKDDPWFGAPQASGERELLASYAQAVGAKHIVQGHQHNDVIFADGLKRHSGEMFQRWGLLFLIDVGMSREINASSGAALRISRYRATCVCPNREETVLWDGREPIDVGRAKPCAEIMHSGGSR